MTQSITIVSQKYLRNVMIITTAFFIIIALIISYIDAKKGLIPDKIILPAIAILIVLKYFDNVLSIYDFIAAGIVLVLFVIPIALNMAFGGGDLRFGVFCALYVGLNSVGYFILLAGVIHLLFLLLLKKRSFGFAPAMSIAALLSYSIGSL